MREERRKTEEGGREECRKTEDRGREEGKNGERQRRRRGRKGKYDSLKKSLTKKNGMEKEIGTNLVREEMA